MMMKEWQRMVKVLWVKSMADIQLAAEMQPQRTAGRKDYGHELHEATGELRYGVCIQLWNPPCSKP